MDVAWTELLVAVPVRRLLLSGVQLVCTVSVELPSGGSVARERAQRRIFRAVCRQCGDHVHGDTGEDSIAGQGTISADDVGTEEGKCGRLWRCLCTRRLDDRQVETEHFRRGTFVEPNIFQVSLLSSEDLWSSSRVERKFIKFSLGFNHFRRSKQQ